MSIYDSGVAAYRDTTKWLVAFVPLAGLLAAAVTIGPDLVRSVSMARSPQDWLGDNWLTGVCLIVILAGVVAILYWGAKVLSVAPTDLGQLQSQAFAPKLATAIGAGVVAPEFFSPESFKTAMAALANSFDKQNPTEADEFNLTRVKGAVDNLRQWSIFDKASSAFRRFIIAFAIATAAIGLGTVLAASQLDSSPAISEPTAVVVEVNKSGSADLRESTKCTSARTTTFVAISGSWQHPTLAVDGPGCSFGAQWAPRSGTIEMLPAPEPP